MLGPFIICEAGLNHDGSVQHAFDLVEAAKRTGADAVKFQTYIPEKLLSRGDPDFAELARLALPFEAFERLAARAETLGIEFMSTPGDVESLRFLVERCGVKRLKIGSDDLTNAELLKAAFDTGLPVLLSTGMASFDEVDDALYGDDTWNLKRGEVTLLHCVSLYPTPDHLLNLRAIGTLRKLGNPVGYSDHTDGVLAPIIAAGLGATVIEKHLKLLGTTLVDDVVSVDPHRFASMVREIKAVAEMLGDGVKLPSAQEREAAQRLRKGSDGLRGAA